MKEQEIKQITLLINDNDAIARLKQLEGQLQKAQKRKKELDNTMNSRSLNSKELIEYKRTEAEIKKLETKIGSAKNTAAQLGATLNNLSGSTIRELRSALKTLNAEMERGDVKRNTKEWDAYQKAISKVKNELTKIKNEQKAALDPPTRREKWIKLLGNASLIAQSVTAVGRQVYETTSQYVEAYAQMAEAESQVIKYTGMSREEVTRLNEAFKQMDTRTPREKLNALAGDAGRLGIQTQEGVKDFVEAADQINVALGEDLGEDAVKNIGKLAQLFGDDKTKGLKGAMLATGSVINELAQSSSAAEAYLVDFTARLGGVGAQAHMTQAQIMAYGSVLDQNMVAQEKGATALQNVITALYRKPAEMARLAGMDVQKFTKMLRTDGNAALLEFTKALHATGSMDALAPLLDEMKLSGAGVTQTLSVLAANIDKVQATQQQATAAFEAGTSVTKEFNAANNTPMAELEKNRKRFHDLTIELGSRLYPVLNAGMGVAGGFLSVLSAIGSFIGSHIGTITRLSVVIGGYVAVVALMEAWERRSLVTKALLRAETILDTALTKADTIATLLLSAAKATLTGNIARARDQMRLLRLEMMMNPYAAIAAAILAVGVAIYTLLTRTKELTAAQIAQNRHAQTMVDVHKQVAEATAEERTKVEHLSRVIHSNAYSYGERQAAINRLQKIVPGYHATLTQEGKIINENTNAIRRYLQELDNKAMAEAYYDKLVAINKRIVESGGKVQRKENNVKAVKAYAQQNNIELGPITSASPWGSYTTYTEKGEELRKQQFALNDARKEYDAAAREKQLLLDSMGKDSAVTKAVNQRLTAGETTASIPTGSAGGGGGGKTSTDKKKKNPTAEQIEKKRIETALYDIEKSLNDTRTKLMADMQKGVIDVREYESQILGAETYAASQRVEVYKEGTDERLKAEEEYVKKRQEVAAMGAAWSIADVEREEAERLAVIEEQQARGLLSERAYTLERNRITLEALDERRRLYREAGNVQELERAEEAYAKESDRQKEEAQRQHLARIKALREKFLTESEQERYARELADLKEAHDEKLLSEEAYLAALARLRAEHDQREKDEKKSRDEKDGWGEATRRASESGPRSEFADSVTALGQAIAARRIAFAEIEKMEQEGVISHKEAEDRKREISEDNYGQIVQIANAAYATINSALQGASQYAQACYEADAAKVTARYDAEIAAVGSSTTRGRMLEEKKQKELAALKTKGAKRANAMQMAQALAMIPISALNAYNSAAQTPIVGPVLAPIAAAAAVAAGMLQIATLKKQQEAQSAGYYHGGFTGGNAYHREAGVVHEGEFVANHKAVSNRSLLPVLRLIDHAQRTNTIATLTSSDVSRALPATTSSVAAPPQVVAVREDTRTVAAVEQLNRTLEEGISSYVVIDGPNGLDRRYRQYQRQKGRL